MSERCMRCDGEGVIRWLDRDGWQLEDDCPDCAEPPEPDFDELLADMPDDRGRP